jgi:hypothetical protein
MAPIRRLPMLQDASAADEDRPAWQWAVIGLVFILSIWAPLAMFATWCTQRLVALSSGHRLGLWLAVTLPPMVTFAFSCWAAGALVGRFGGKAGVREAVLAGSLAALVGAGLTFIGANAATSVASLIVLAPVGLLGAWFGGRFGFARRVAVATRQAPPPPEKRRS